MTPRLLSFSALPVAASAILLGMACLPAFGQSTGAANLSSDPTPSNWKPPLARDGHPDLEGIWTNKTITPLERPKNLGTKAFFTEAEAKAFTQQRLARGNKDNRARGTIRDVLNAYNDFWWDSGTKVLPNMRTSIIVDPPDGRIPPLTAHAIAEMQERREAVKVRCERPGCEITNGGQPAPADKPSDLDLQTRCISFGTVVPMLPTAYNNNYQIVQSPGMVAIDTEMVHDVRRIPTDNSAHLPPSVREWTGDPRGHWEGNTLVVDSTNFMGEAGLRLRGADENLHIIERFTRVGPNTLLYRFTVEDPTVFTKPWSGEIPLTKIAGPLYEYACHEGNIGMRDILVSAKRDEQKAAKQAAEK